ncbi:acyl-CoA/acyl-ACP dehydrogenase [Aestuariicella hydrocarbonica]|uniref:Acyl-CoA/acyl-ACP dehydrogenase n=1 Tax=Pseudomaricurvus hydrocarbonicus TaxID=1470433 RepID=A0A9E5JWY3_9GAMM|nr:acyl-CoA dehydrogenase family protein [Aestuariicella hydrocarbonica]NHO66086.1 acyl-CoA/acyl-ACP dehydrogenase [Aestuariicella hydrocarbonica]
MEFAFTDEQQMIRDTAEAFLAEVSTSEAVRQAMVTDQGYDHELWQRICTELYWQAIHIPEAYGGLGLGYVELVAMLEQMGRYLLCSPFFSTVCLGANALIVAGTEAQKAEFLPQICDGKTATLAYTGYQSARHGGQWGADAVSTTVFRDGEDFILNGTLRYVPDGASAQLLVVAARAEGSLGAEGISLFVLSADEAGISRRLLPTMDQTRKQGEIVLTDVRVPAAALMGAEGQAWSNLEAIVDLANVALAAEQMGGAQQLLDMTVDYTKERQQFNRPIAGFQAIKHMAADMMTRVEVARSGVYYAACIAEEFLQKTELAVELPEAASVAKSYCADAYFQNASDALQMHGGVGFTWEYDVHLYFKRAKASEHFLGNGDYHRERLAQWLLDQDERGE